MAPELMVQVVGRFGVSLAGQVVPAIEVGSRKARRLLAVLAVRQGHVSTDLIVTAVWGDEPPRDPSANVATLVSRLRATLGTPAIVGSGEGYRLGDQVMVDLLEAGALVSDAEALRASEQPALALMAARCAAHLLGQEPVLVEEPGAWWVEPARAWHDRLLRRNRRLIAETALRVGDPQEARVAALDAVHRDPLDEAACRLLMRAYLAAGEPARALRVYHELRTTLVAELGVGPALATRNLLVTVLRDTAPAPSAR